MTSISPSPSIAIPSLIAPSSAGTSPPSSTFNSSETSAPPTSLPDQTTDPPVSSTSSNSLAPTVQSPPPSVPSAPPPASPLSPPPPSPPASPPPSPPASPPPSPSASPPPPPAVSPPSPPAAPPPAATLSPPPVSSPTTPAADSPPPVSAPPPPQVVSLSPPPPADVPSPHSSRSPPSPPAKSPETSPSPPSLTPPPTSSPSAPPPPSTSTAPSTSVPSASSSPSASPSSGTSNSSASRPPRPSALPTIPTEKPTAKPTTENNATSSKSGLSTGGAVAIGIAVGFVVLSLVVMAVWFTLKRKRRNSGTKVGYDMPSPLASSQKSDSAFLPPHSPTPLVNGSNSDFVYSPPQSGGLSNSKSWFTYEELVQATNGFSLTNLLGEGGFGCVYKGVLTDGREVAVKQLNIGGGQGEREFRAEVETISRVHHRHLVSLVGYCISDHQRLLVYDFLSNDTLHHHIHGDGRPVMDWARRVKVVAGAARGIAYLHEDCHPRIIHRDIKSSNILLDDNFDALVSDFGLARLALDTNTHVSTRVMGTFGYLAPEYATSGKLTEKSDVYSFGVVLLELITGRMPVDDAQPVGEESLVEWARPLLAEVLENEEFKELVDPRLGDNYVKSEMFRMIEAAAACIRHSASRRPRMSQVVRALNSLDELSDLTNGMRPGQSEVFNAAQQSSDLRMFQRLAFGNQDYSSSYLDHSRSSWQSRESQESWSHEHRDKKSTLMP